MMSSPALAELRGRATYPEGRYHAWKDEGWGIELEVGDFLWGLVRVLRPKLVLESGTGIGLSARFMGAACRENCYGRVITFEPDRALAERAWPGLKRFPVEIRGGDTLEWASPRPDFVFLDSYPGEVRRAEIEKWLEAGVWLAVHDAERYELPPGLCFPTPRGMWVGRGPADG